MAQKTLTRERPLPRDTPSLAAASQPDRTRRRLRWRIPPIVAVCLVLMALLALAAIFAPLIAPHDPLKQSLATRNRPPAWLTGGSTNHVLGTDNLGYDILSRILYGARVSLGIGLVATLIGTLLGTALGLLAGFFRGPLDWLIMLAVDTQLATPFIVIAIAAIAAFGKSLTILVVLAGVSGWMLFARACRSSVLALREREFVTAARALGATHTRILLRELLPNVALPLVAFFLLGVAVTIVVEGALSFLGLGVPPPAPSWGSMIGEGRESLDITPWLAFMPAGVMFATVLAFNVVGDTLRALTDPRPGAL